MKIGYVLDTTLDSDAGVQQYFKGLARYMLKNGDDIRFLVPSSNNQGEFKDKIYCLGKSINPIGNTTSVPIGSIAFGKEIKKILNKEKFDIIHVALPFSPFMGAKVASLASCPVVATYMIYSKNLVYQFGSVLLRFLTYRGYKKIDKFIASSKAAYDDAIVTFPGEYEIIPLGVDTSNFSPEVKPISKYNDNMKNIVYLNRLEERKGARYLIQAFKLVKEKIPLARLIIAGDGPLKQDLIKEVEELSLKDVKFEGYVKESVKPSYYAAAKICVFPSIYGECFGVVLIESLASGKVTLGFSNEGYSWVLKNLPELIVENKNVKQLAEKIILFLSDDEKRLKYEELCLKESSLFSWEVIGKHIRNIYSSLM